MEIQIRNLSKSFDGNKVLDNINLSFSSGKIYGLRGKNGSGKTMLLRSIAGLIIPDSGEIVIDGKVLGKDLSFPEEMGLLIESPGYIGSYSGIENLKIIGEINNKATTKDMEDMMEYLGLDSKDMKKVKKYSLGMKQKLGISMALMEKPRLIILDEPLNALDEGTSKKVLEYLIKLRDEQGAIILVASHDREELEYLADEIVEISQGKIVEDHHDQ